MRPTLRHAALPLALLAAGCVTNRYGADPTVTLHTSGGQELGVATPEGVVFLGSTARSGEVDLTVWFGDGPSIEASVVEPLGDGLFLCQGEIRFPSSEVAFHRPVPGDEVIARGRWGHEVWEAELVPVVDDAITGLVFEDTSDVPHDATQTGAGVFWTDPDTGIRHLVGLLSGRVVVGDRTYLAAVGSEGLWRLVAYRRDVTRTGPRPYRDDIL